MELVQALASTAFVVVEGRSPFDAEGRRVTVTSEQALGTLMLILMAISVPYVIEHSRLGLMYGLAAAVLAFIVGFGVCVGLCLGIKQWRGENPHQRQERAEREAEAEAEAEHAEERDEERLQPLEHGM